MVEKTATKVAAAANFENPFLNKQT